MIIIYSGETVIEFVVSQDTITLWTPSQQELLDVADIVEELELKKNTARDFKAQLHANHLKLQDINPNITSMREQ